VHPPPITFDIQLMFIQDIIFYSELHIQSDPGPLNALIQGFCMAYRDKEQHGASGRWELILTASPLSGFLGTAHSQAPGVVLGEAGQHVVSPIAF